MAGCPAAEVGGRAATALQDAGLGPDELAVDRLAEELSGGQLQRVAVARALAVRPRLLADEPTSELDEVSRDVVLAALRRVADSGGCVVLATHDSEVAARCDTRLTLEPHY